MYICLSASPPGIVLVCSLPIPDKKNEKKQKKMHFLDFDGEMVDPHWTIGRSGRCAINCGLIESGRWSTLRKGMEGRKS